jgi:hypothetical protein
MTRIMIVTSLLAIPRLGDRDNSLQLWRSGQRQSSLVIYKGIIMLDRVGHNLPVVTSQSSAPVSPTFVRNF